jgi:hypothetical protein
MNFATNLTEGTLVKGCLTEWLLQLLITTGKIAGNHNQK